MRLTTLSELCRVLVSQIRQLPDGDYRDWCNYHIQRLIAAGRELGESLPLVCENCTLPFYATTDSNRPERWCANCQEDRHDQ